MRVQAVCGRVSAPPLILLSLMAALPTHASPRQPKGQAPSVSLAGTNKIPSVDTANIRKALTAFGNLPLRFEGNVGQTDRQVQFVSRGAGYTLFLAAGEAIFSLPGSKPAPRGKTIDHTAFRNSLPSKETEATVFRMKIEGAAESSTITGIDKLPGVTNYLIGNDPSQWHQGIESYSKVQYSEIYSGVDLIYYGNQHQLEYDFIVKPGADPKQLSLRFDGMESMAVDSAGNIAISTKAGNLTLRKPKIYQLQNGEPVAVDGNFRKNGNNHIGFEVAPFDRTKPLVIDPILVYSTYLGGSGQETAEGVAVDSSGDAYVLGFTYSADFPIVGSSISGPPSGSNDVAFVSKLNATGTALVYSTFLGGSAGWTQGFKDAIDSSGHAYVLGETSASNFPVTSSAFQTSLASGAAYNAFLAVLSADGQSLVYSTFLGGGGWESGNGIGVDASQNAYVAGQTGSTNFPTTSNAFQTSAPRTSLASGFLSRIDTTASGSSSLVYSTYLGGSSSAANYSDGASGVAVDSSHNAYVTGWACTQNFPVTSSAYQSSGSPTYCSAFLSQIDTAGSGSSSLTYSTYLGGKNTGDYDSGYGVALDTSSNAYVSGWAGSSDFPTTTGSTNSSGGKAFVAKFDTSQSGSGSLLHSTLVGGSSSDTGASVQADPSGNIYLAGWTWSSDFPVTSDAVQSSVTQSGGSTTSFFTILSPDMSRLVYSTYFGGNPASGYYDGANEVALDQSENIYLAGQTSSTAFETTSGAFQTTLGGYADGYLAKLSALPAAPAITSSTSTTFTVGAAGSFTVTGTGAPTPTLSESGSLPSGVTFNSSTGVLGGTPASGTGGTYSITFTASNGVGSNATQNFTLTVVQPPAITSGNSTAFTVGTAGSFTVTVSGFPGPTLSESGALPTGVSFNNATGVLSGTPSAGTAGSYSISFTASNGVGSNASQTFTLTVNQVSVITSANYSTFEVGTSGSFTVTTTGSPTPTLSESGTLPSGVTFTAASGVLAGTPTSGAAGVYPVTFTAHNGIGGDATQTFTLTVSLAPAITSANNTTFTIGVSGFFTVTATGVPTPTFSETGTLPSGVTLSSAGVLSGTPSAGTGGTYPITVTASNGVSPNATQGFTLTVSSTAAPVIISANNTTLTIGAAGSFTVAATGVPAPTLSESGSLPTGVTFNAGTGVLSGTPSAGTVGNYPITFTASNGVGSNATQNFTLTVNTGAAPTITSANNTTFSLGNAGSFTVVSTGTPTPTFSEYGPLPAGVTFSAAGVLAGIPAPGTTGSYPIAFTASNGIGSNATQNFTLKVVTPSFLPSFTSPFYTTFTVGTAGTFTVTATGNPIPPINETGTLPPGVMFNGTTGVLSGTPEPGTSGTYSIEFTVSNTYGESSPQNFTLTVQPAPLSGYSYIRAITISHTKVVNAGGYDFINFPVLITGTYSYLATTSNGGSVTNTNGYDIGFASDEAGLNVLAFEQESYNATTGAITFWVSVPALSPTTDTTIYVFYGNASVTQDQSNRSEVWGSDYRGVWHLGDGTTLSVMDSTKNANNGTDNGATSISGQINGAANFSGSSEYINLGTSPTLRPSGPVTASAWIKASNSQLLLPVIISDGDSTGTTGYNLYLNNNQASFILNVGGWGTSCVAQGTSSLNDNSWHYVVGTYAGAGGAVSVYVDGVLQATSTCPNQGTGYGTSPAGEIGWKLDQANNDAFTGGIDEARISSLALTADWITTEYNNQSSPSTFYSVGSLTTAPTITSANNTTFVSGTSGSFTVTVTGNPLPTLSESGALPSGVSFDATTGVLAGTPAVGTSGSFPITFTASNGPIGSDSSQNFTLTVIQPAPAITSAASTVFELGTAGTFTVTATGSPVPTLSESGALPAGVTFDTATDVLAGTPSVGTLGTYPITFTADNGVGSDATQNFNLVVQYQVSIASLSTNSAAVGTTITINGAGFTTGPGTPSVSFNGVTAVPSLWSDISLQVVVPTNATSGPVVVSSNGVPSNSAAFTVVPTISSLSPNTGTANSTIVISGTGFGPSLAPNAVTFYNNVVATPTSWSPSEIQVSVPSNATTGAVTVTLGGASSNGVTFTVTSTGAITGTVTSTNGGSAVSGASVRAIFSGALEGSAITGSDGSYSIAGLPPGLYDVTIFAAGFETSTSPAILVSPAATTMANVVLGAPTIGSLLPSSGPVGTSVTISGSSFGPPTGLGVVAFNNVPGAVTSWSSTQIIALVPTSATSGPVVVTVGGLTSNGVTFTIGAGTVTGTITRTSDSTAISGASIEALQSNVAITSTNSDSNGNYSLSSLTPGAYDLRISASGYGTVLLTGNSVTAGGSITVNASLASPGTISGAVTIAGGSTAITGATVTVLQGTDTVGATTTNGSGTYSVGTLSAGTYTVQVGASGYSSQTQTGISVTASNTTTANFSLAGQSVITYSYDSVGRLTGVVDSLGDAVAYSYDAVGNLTSISRNASTQVSIIGFSPRTGPVGTTVTINGTAFSATPSQNTVAFNGTSATVSSATATQLAVVVPSGASSGTISITSPSGSATSGASFTVTSSTGTPTISTFSPSIGVAGASVTISGTNFGSPANDNTKFNITAGTVISSTPTTITENVPTAATSGHISVSTLSGKAVSSGYFFVPPSPYTVASVGYTGSITSGNSNTVTISSANQVGLLVFDGTVGERAALNIASSFGGAVYYIYGPSGTLITSESIVGPGANIFLSLPVMTSSGTYTILVVPQNNGTGSATLTLSASADISEPIAFNTPTMVTITTPGQNANLTFTGTAGQLITLSVSQSVGESSVESILNPDGSTLASLNSTVSSDFTNVLTLSENGTYTIHANMQGGTTGTVTLTVISDISQTIATNGIPPQLTFTTPGQTAYLTFSGTSGQNFDLEIWDAASAFYSCQLNVSVLNPDTTTLLSDTCMAGNWTGNYTLPQTGTYTVMVAPQGTATGSLYLSLEVYPGPSPLPTRSLGATLDSSNPLSTDLVGLFLMNEGTGTTDTNLADSQAASFAGSSVPVWNTSDPSVAFGGGSSLNSYLNAGTDLIFDQLTPNKLTIVAKVYVNSTGTNGGGIAEKSDGDTGGSGFIFGFDSSGVLYLRVEKSTSDMLVGSDDGMIPAGQWVQFAVTWDGTVGTAAAAQLFVNGQAVPSAYFYDGSGTINYSSATNQPFRIGNDIYEGSLNGKIAYLAVYKGRILTTTEMNALDSNLPIH